MLACTVVGGDTLSTPVLIVDDDDAIRESLRWALEEEGYTVYEAPDGKPALVRLCEHPEGMVVVLDIELPSMDGVGLMQVLAAQASLAERHAYIIITAHRGTLPPVAEHLFTRLGATVFGKPFDLHAFLAAVASAAQRLARVPS